MRELLLMFYWTSFEAVEELEAKGDTSKLRTVITGLKEEPHAKILLARAERYREDILRKWRKQITTPTYINFTVLHHLSNPNPVGQVGPSFQTYNKTLKESQNPKVSPVVPYFTLQTLGKLNLKKKKYSST